MNLLKKATLATALTASALAGVSPAMARDHHYNRHNGNDAGVAIAGGLIGLAIGAAIASSSNHRNDRYYDNRYDNDGYYYRDGYYYDRQGYRYDRQHNRDDYYRRGYRGGAHRGY